MLKSTRVLVLVSDSSTKCSYSIILKVADSYSKLVYSTPALLYTTELIHTSRTAMTKQHLTNATTLMLNGFPRSFSCLALKDKPRRPTNSFKSSTCLLHGTTDNIQRTVLNDVGVRVAIRPFVTIGKSLVFPTNPLDVNEITDIVYQVLCHDCPFDYIGLSKRNLKSRLSEQKRAINYQRPEKSALCKHFIILDHIIDWNKATILSTEKDYTLNVFLLRTG